MVREGSQLKLLFKRIKFGGFKDIIGIALGINILLPFYIVAWYIRIELVVLDFIFKKIYEKKRKILKIVLILYWYESEYDREGNSHNDKIWYLFQNSWYIPK